LRSSATNVAPFALGRSKRSSELPEMKPIYLTGAVRTPIGRFGGSLQSWTAADLGTAVAKESLRRAHIRPDQIDDSIWGCARQAAGGPNVAQYYDDVASRNEKARSKTRPGDVVHQWRHGHRLVGRARVDWVSGQPSGAAIASQMRVLKSI